MRIKKVLIELVRGGIAQEPFLRAWRKFYLRKKVMVLTYHEILRDQDEIDAWTVVRESTFIRQMEYLRRHFKIVSLSEAIESMERKNRIKENLVVLTFDDGYSGNEKVMFPIIKAMNIPVTIFISTKAVQDQVLYWYDELILALQSNGSKGIILDLNPLNFGTLHLPAKLIGEPRWTHIQGLLTKLKSLLPQKRKKAVASILKQLDYSYIPETSLLTPLSIQQVQELSKSKFVSIGAHSHCHNILVQLSDAEIQESTDISKGLLEKWTGSSVQDFAYPNGDYNNQVIEILRSVGFICGLTVISRPWRKSDSHFEIPRIGIGRYDSFASFKMHLSGLSI